MVTASIEAGVLTGSLRDFHLTMSESAAVNTRNLLARSLSQCGQDRD